MPDFKAALALIDELIEQQKIKVLKVAREISPGVTAEDIRNPQDLPKLHNNAWFHFEDGILAGYLSAKMALLAEETSPTNIQNQKLNTPDFS